MHVVKKVTEEEKIKSAYALNMCTVSVSQIVDYDDLNVLEQEYDAILNNLNLEKIIKNDALLSILKQILDTITYFKMEAIEKEIIEKEYQQQMKNAIWSAVPNFGLIVAGGNPLTMAISLASQVGIGYMNYRRNKNSYTWEKDKSYMKLHQAALEQLNGLRRELFTTAWNLAETYEFKDELRLTEKQIKQYNDILSDTDELRKYERLSYIKNNFEAYPPFWYFYGNCANFIANDKSLPLSNDTRTSFKSKAKECFEKYNVLDKYNILRENQITSAYALEYADLLLEDSKPDIPKIEELLAKAEVMAPNSYDVLELCAITYMKINDTVAASKLLKFLVNEDYNKVINGQLLSGILVCNKNVQEYELLTTRVGKQYLYPLPKKGEDPEELYNKFIIKQKEVLKKKYSCVIDEIIDKYSIEWNKIHSTFDYSDYEDSFFANNKLSYNIRLEMATRVFSKESSKSSYLDKLVNQNILLCMIDVLNKSAKGLFSLPSINDSSIQEKAIEVISLYVSQNKDNLNKLLLKAANNQFGLSEYNQLQSFSLESIYKDVTLNFKNKSNLYIDTIQPTNLSSEEGKLRLICLSEKIKEPEIVLGERSSTIFEISDLPFTPDIFGISAIVAQKKSERINKAVSVVKDFIDKIKLKDNTVDIYVKKSTDFDRFFQDSIFEEYAAISSHALVVIKDKSKASNSLILTSEGVVSIKKGKIISKTPYNEVELKNDKLLIYNTNFFTDKENFITSAIDSSIVYDLCRLIRNSFEKKVSDNLEFIDSLDGNVLSAWFKKNTTNLDECIKMVLAYPTDEIMKKFGFFSEYNLSPNKNVMQFIYDEDSSYILAFRIIEFNSINTNLQAQLEENDGIIHFQK